MYKYFFVVIFVIISLLISGYTLKGKISYTPEEARIEAFKDIDLRINMDAYSQYLVDKNYYDNMKILNQKSNKLKKYKNIKIDISHHILIKVILYFIKIIPKFHIIMMDTENLKV